MDQQYSVKWTNYHNQITNAFDSLKNEEDLVDVTLSCEGKKLKAHKMLLSACSPYFRDIFKDNPCQHPVIVFRNFKFVDLEAIIDFMYKGEVDVKQEQFQSFLGTAELLEVKGLTENSAKPNYFEDDDSNASKTFGSEIDLLPEHPSTMGSSTNKQDLPASRAEVSPSPPTRKRKSSFPPDKSRGRALEKKQKPTEIHEVIVPKIEQEDYVEDLTFDEDNTEDHSSSTDLSSRPEYNTGSNQQNLSQQPKGLVHVPEPGSSLELPPDIMQTEDIDLHATGNQSSPEAVGSKEQDDMKTGKHHSSAKIIDSSGLKEHTETTNVIQETKTILIAEDCVPDLVKRYKKSDENQLKYKKLNLPKSLTVTVKEKNIMPPEINQTKEDQTTLRSEEAKTPIQEELFPNQQQVSEINTACVPNLMLSEESERAEEAPCMSSNEDVEGNQVQEVVEEGKEEPEFDFFGCEVCKAENKLKNIQIDKSKYTLTQKCPICPYTCFCAHILKEHMKAIHGWFNVQRRFNQY